VFAAQGFLLPFPLMKRKQPELERYAFHRGVFVAQGLLFFSIDEKGATRATDVKSVQVARA